MIAVDIGRSVELRVTQLRESGEYVLVWDVGVVMELWKEEEMSYVGQKAKGQRKRVPAV